MLYRIIGLLGYTFWGFSGGDRSYRL